MADSDRRLSELPLLTESERHQLLVEWNKTQMDYPEDKSIHELFEDQVQRTPDAIAVVFEDQQLTYRKLNCRANQLAHYLRKRGVGPDVLVGICVERSLEMVVGLLGILKAGGAYVPLDPDYPGERLEFMLADSQALVLLTQQRLSAELFEDRKSKIEDDDPRPAILNPRIQVVCLDTDWNVIARESEENPLGGVTGDNLAYVIYTSGSTGRPKGVMNTHRGICNRLLWMQDTYRLTQADRVLQKTPFSFDVSVWEFFWPLIAGARLIVARPEGHRDAAYLVNLISEQQITTLHFVPSMLQSFLEAKGLEACGCVKLVFSSGEPLSFELQQRFFARLGAELHNLYGPTEASIDVTFWACKRESDQRVVPIGRPIANMQIYLLDSHLQPVPIGAPGELHIGGLGLARGYVNRPELTSEKFIPNPFGDEPGTRLYKTGDLARYLPDGNIEFLGRLDYQVKIRGFRVELGEIEAVLGQHPAVRAAVVLVREDAFTDKHLVAYVVPEQNQAPTARKLRRFLREKLPETMVPAAVVMRDTLPLTPNGKVDRRALATLNMTDPVLTAAEQLLLAEWNDTKADNSRDKCIHQLFEEQVERTPHTVAVVCERKQLTYAQLNTKANQLAHHLQALGVGPEVVVGVCVERSLEMTVALLGILKAGAAYVPLDPTYPKERLAFMLAETQAPVSLTQRRLLAGLPEHAAKVVCLDVEWEVIAKESVESPASGVTVDNLAYVVYTSGSTGRPKGVAMSHRSLGNLLWWQLQNSTLTSGARTLQFASLSFDVSFQEIFSTWFSGGTLALISEGVRRDAAALLGFLKVRSVERLFVPFVALQQLAEVVHGRGSVPASLREIITAGKQLQVTPHIASLFRNLKDCTLYNQYGPSESHVVTAFTFTGSPSNWPALPPIGRPIANTQVYVLDASLNQVPVRAPGELHIGGVGLARGYLNRPDLTAEKFIPNPFSGEPGSRLYKTGDLARYLPDGNIEFLGRLDHQVKIRGYRIELGEVEAILRQHPGVREAVVLAQEDESGDKRLVAYVILRKETAAPASELRSFLTEKLPGHMVPSVFVPLEALPLTPNGKVDRRALPALGPHRSEPAGAYVEPGTATERLLAKIWAEVLGMARIGANGDFFALGGHSLKATLIIARILDTFGVELSHRCFFEAPTLTALAERIDRSQPRPPNVQPLLIEAVERDQTAPLTWGQTEIWLTSQLEPSVPVYNEPFTIYMNEPVDPVALEEALNKIIRRHEILRMAFTIRGDQPVQVIQDEVKLTLSVADLGSLPESDREVEALQLVTAEARRLFNLSEPPLVRATLVRISEADCRLYLTLHHIVTDAYSIYNVLIPELWQLYESGRARKQSPLRELPVQYAQYARWQRRRLRGAELEKSLNYWKNQLDGAMSLELPTDRLRPRVRTFRGAYQSFALSKELTDALNALSRREGVTLYMMLLAAFKTLLWRYAQQDEIVVGTAEAGRNRPEFEPLLGYFLNTLVLRCHIADNPKFHHFLQRVREVTLQAYAHRDLPFAKLVEELQPTHDPSRHPLFQVAFVMEPTMLTHESGWTISQFDVQTGTSKFDLTLELEERAEGIIGRFEYNTDLLDGETIGRMIAHLQALLEGIVATPHRRLSDLPLLTEAEKHQQLVQWNDTIRDYPRDKCIHQLFEAQAERSPEAVAVIFENQQLTYRKLNRRANQLAHFLRKLAVGPEVRVGICMERSPEMIVAVLGILKAGGAYVPLDPEYPKDRLSYMLEDSQAQVLLTQKRLVAELIEDRRSEIEEGDPRIQVVCLDTDWQVIAQESESNPISGARADNLAYLIYTSGSTGRPKGALMEHRGLCNLAEAQIQSFDLRPDNRILQFSSLSFDASIFEIVMALRMGATLCLGTRDSLLPGPALSQLLRDQAVTNITIPPSSLATLPAEKLPLLRTIIAAGEACSADLVARWATGHRFFNAFGPTEATVWATVAECVDGGRKPPIGRPIANTQIYLLDAHLQPVPVGVPGELHIGGVGLARGYLNRPDLSAEKFIPNPFSDESGARLYKTGDLGRYLPDGNIEFLGRIDHQVKIHGFRIELGEIEAVLAGHPALEGAVVLAREDEPGAKRLVAYVVANQIVVPSTSQLRSFLKSKLPDYMVPSAFVFLDSLPLTPNGKVDRRALPSPQGIRSELQEAFVAPRTPVEEMIAEVWAEVLKVEKVGIHDNFFDLGGHSLLATQVMSRLRHTFQLELPLRTFFETPTIAGIAEAIEQTKRNGSAQVSAIVPVSREAYRVKRTSLTGVIAAIKKA